MAEHSTIEWTDATWNPITGCSIVSPGCTHCYAMKLAGTRLKNHPSRAGLTRDSKAGPVWTGEVRLNEQWLTQPLAWRRPRRIFVCAHGDLFAESVPDAWIDLVFAIMAMAPQHTFQVPTKRSARMRLYLSDPETPGRIALAALVKTLIERAWPLDDATWPVRSVGDVDLPDDITIDMPLPNVWLGVSAEDQARANERVPDLLATPAAIRFVSAEPLLGPIEFLEADPYAFGRSTFYVPKRKPDIHPPIDAESTISDVVAALGGYVVDHGGIDWIIVGGESGPGARPMHAGWVRSIREQCAAANVPFFFKQWGEFNPHGQSLADGSINALGNPDDPRWRSFGEGQTSWRIGKARAGRRLDDHFHDAMPEVRS